MLRRSDLAFRQEMKFRNRLVDYVTDWVLRSEEEIQNMAKEVLAISWWETLCFVLLLKT